jgi:hypothetical protein
MADGVFRALKNTEPFRTYTNPVVTLGNGFFSIKPEMAFRFYLDALALNGADYTASAIRKLVTSKSALVEADCLVWGVRVSSRIRLAPNLFVAPVPKDAVLSMRDELTALPEYLQAPDTLAVLTTRYRVEPVLMDIHAAHELKDAPALSASRLLQEIATALCALGPAPITIEHLNQRFVDPRLATLLPSGRGGPMQQLNPLKSSDPVVVDAASRAYVRAFMALQPDTRETLLRSLERLNASMKRWDPHDQALDCGIAYEILMSNDDGTEIGYRLGLRAALLLGKSLDEREQIRRRVRTLYKLRSHTAHGGGGRKKDPHKNVEIVTAGIDTCASIIREIVRRGRLPEWGALELSARSVPKRRASPGAR